MKILLSIFTLTVIFHSVAALAITEGDTNCAGQRSSQARTEGEAPAPSTPSTPTTPTATGQQ